MVLKFHAAPGFTKRPERVNVAIARLVPAAKLYPQFKCCPGLAHEMRFIDTEHVVEDLDMRQRRLTDADRSDIIGFEGGNAVVCGLESPPDAGGPHPPRRTPAHDDDSERRRSTVIPNRFAHRSPWHRRSREQGGHAEAWPPDIITWRGYRVGSADRPQTSPNPCKPVWHPGSPRNRQISPAGTGSWYPAGWSRRKTTQYGSRSSSESNRRGTPQPSGTPASRCSSLCWR